MDSFHFTCPHCGAHLKTRDRLWMGRPVDCPECRRPFIVTTSAEGLVTRKIEPETESSPAPSRTLADHLRQNRTLFAGVLILAGVLALALGLGWRQVFPPSSRPPVALSQPVPLPPGQNHNRKKAKPPDPAPQEKLTEPERRLLAMGKVLSARTRTDKAFPAGGSRAGELHEEEWFGWLAELVDHLEPHQANVPVVRDRGWRDPLNDAFVRRRIAALQNPMVPALTGDDGYPATHFAGVAGIGEDAARLPVTDPRAGAFAYERRTRLEDIRDGLAQTMIVAGVSSHLGSWAAATASVRPFSREPYINGPDGFGTGQPDSMIVLMADGRVSTLSARTDPAILRGLAAIADQNRPTPPPDQPAIARGPDDQPIEPVHVAEDVVPPELDVPKVRTVAQIEASLAQAITAYEFPPGSAVRLVVLKEVAELTGVPLAIDSGELGPARAKLDEPLGSVPVPILRETTVRDILLALLDPLDLTFRIEPGQLRLIPRPTPSEPQP